MGSCGVCMRCIFLNFQNLSFRTGVLLLDQINPRSVLILSHRLLPFVLPMLMSAVHKPRAHSRKFDRTGPPLHCFPTSLPSRLLVSLSPCLRTSGATGHPSLGAFHRHSNRNTEETGFAVTPTKQTTVIISNRNKKTPPGGVATWLPHRPTLCISTRYTVKVEFAVNPSRSTT